MSTAVIVRPRTDLARGGGRLGDPDDDKLLEAGLLGPSNVTRQYPTSEMASDSGLCTLGSPLYGLTNSVECTDTRMDELVSLIDERLVLVNAS